MLSKERQADIEEIYPDFDKLIVQMSSGEISFKEFVAGINQRFGFNLSEAEMEDIFRQAIVPNQAVIKLVRKLHAGYNLVLLSNNDEMTVRNLKKYHKEMLGLFSKKYFSHELKLEKPDLKFFKHVLHDLNVNASECLFIDDKQKNVAAAKECGMNALLFSSASQLKKDLLSHSIKID
jgi:putative hydrolase of the HAD superfamily